jgi:hypothetical protein
MAVDVFLGRIFFCLTHCIYNLIFTSETRKRNMCWTFFSSWLISDLSFINLVMGKILSAINSSYHFVSSLFFSEVVVFQSPNETCQIIWQDPYKLQFSFLIKLGGNNINGKWFVIKLLIWSYINYKQLAYSFKMIYLIAAICL